MKRRILFLFVGLSFFGWLSGGCHAPMSKTSIGMGIGAAGGALIGQIIGHGVTSTIPGACACALLGGVYGNQVDIAETEYQLDQQRRELERYRKINITTPGKK